MTIHDCLRDPENPAWIWKNKTDHLKKVKGEYLST